MDLNANVRPMITVSGTTPTLGTLMGTGGGATILQNLSSQVGKTYFGTHFDDVNNKFMNLIVKPMEQVKLKLEANINALVKPDMFRPLVTIDDLASVPDCMKIPLLEHPMMRRLHQDGRINAWGILPEDVPEDGTHYRWTYNNRCEDILASMDDDGMVSFTETTWSDDPEMSYEQQRDLYESYRFMENLVETSDVDPTAPSQVRG